MSFKTAEHIRMVAKELGYRSEIFECEIPDNRRLIIRDTRYGGDSSQTPARETADIEIGCMGGPAKVLNLASKKPG